MTVNDALHILGNNYKEILATTSAIVALIWTTLRIYSEFTGVSNSRKKINNDSAVLLSGAIEKWIDNKDKGHYKLVVEQTFFSLFGKALPIKEIIFLLNFESLDTVFKVIKYYKHLKCNVEDSVLEFKYSIALKQKTSFSMFYALSIALSIIVAFFLVLLGFIAYGFFLQKEMMLVLIATILCLMIFSGLTYLMKQTVYKKAAFNLVNRQMSHY